ncbi:MAG: hypothetical protein MJE68_21760 [Proteobacteria bacterium]|nr:hypothetical protein [Pseudomonadota bacterium]
MTKPNHQTHANAHTDSLDAWLEVLLSPPLVADADKAMLKAVAKIEGGRIIVTAMRPHTGVTTKCASLRATADRVGLAIDIIDGGVMTEDGLAKLDYFHGCHGAILLAHKGATAAEISYHLSRLGRATGAKHLVARYPWQKNDDVLRGRDEVIKQLNQAVYRHVLAALPTTAPEIRALRAYAEALQKAAAKHASTGKA